MKKITWEKSIKKENLSKKEMKKLIKQVEEEILEWNEFLAMCKEMLGGMK